MGNFEERLRAAYQAWHDSRGRAPERFFALYAEEIEIHSILETSLAGNIRGPYCGKPAAIAYFGTIAEQWEMIEGRLDTVIARGDKAVCIGHVQWRNVRTLRVIAGPKVDIWTARHGLAVHYFEMFDSYGWAHAMGIVDPPEP